MSVVSVSLKVADLIPRCMSHPGKQDCLFASGVLEDDKIKYWKHIKTDFLNFKL